MLYLYMYIVQIGFCLEENGKFNSTLRSNMLVIVIEMKI